MSKPKVKIVEQQEMAQGPTVYLVEIVAGSVKVQLQCKNELHAQVVVDALRQCSNVIAI